MAGNRIPQDTSLPKSISVVIPNYNGHGLLEKNLPPIYAALENSGCIHEVIVADDCSSDDSVSFLRSEYPEIIVAESPVNGGFAVNINRGIAIAKFDLVLLLNSDIRLETDYFRKQLHYFDLNDTFGVMGKIINEDDGTISEGCKYPLPAVFKVNHFKNIVPARPYPYTYYLSGANALVDRKKLILLNGFNELYSPFYQEDLDLSLRAWELDWKCYYENDAVCYHEVSATIPAYHQRKNIQIINSRNKLILQTFHLTGWRLWLWGSIQLLSLLIRWALGQGYYYPGFVLFLEQAGNIQERKRDFLKLQSRLGSRLSLTVIKEQVRMSTGVN